jgi:hypothetical protein
MVRGYGLSQHEIINLQEEEEQENQKEMMNRIFKTRTGNKLTSP